MRAHEAALLAGAIPLNRGVERIRVDVDDLAGGNRMIAQAAPQLSIRAIALSIVLAMILAAANTYLGLFAGLTIASAIPAAVVSMAVLRASLSTIARAITGTAWNGPRFFGLRTRRDEPKHRQAARPVRGRRSRSGRAQS
jgi:hypothetical protein